MTDIHSTYPTCKTCRFWYDLRRDNFGECHVNPPGDPDYQSGQLPVSWSTHWCIDHQTGAGL